MVFDAFMEDGCTASVSFCAALKLQFLTLPCPALSLNPSRTSRPPMPPRDLRPQAKSTAWAGRLQGLPFIGGGPRAYPPRCCLDLLPPQRLDSRSYAIR